MFDGKVMSQNTLEFVLIKEQGITYNIELAFHSIYNMLFSCQYSIKPFH